MSFWLMVIALLIGGGLSVQVGLNSQVRHYLGDPALAALGNFLVGTVVILAYLLLMRTNWPTTGALRAVPPVNWLGGLFGATYVAASAFLAPRLGSAPLLALLIGGQLLMSLVLDHFGWIGFAPHEMNWPRVAGAALLVAGVVLIVRN
jgi:bacterial/archaeal transporter family-2 protein